MQRNMENGRGRRRSGILIVDHEALTRNELHAGLRKDGFAVWVAEDGREAVETYRRHAPAIDLVLLEVSLPDLDGPRTLGALRQINPQVRCCFMSGQGGAYSDEELLSLRATLLNKPFVAAEIAPFLRLLVDRPIHGPHHEENSPTFLSWRQWGRAARHARA